MALENQLIFIISQPRSGSTLTQKLLSNNSYVDTASETWLLLPFLTVFRTDLVKARFQTKYSAQGISELLEKGNNRENYQAEIKKFLLSQYPLENGKKYFIDKTPRYYEILDEIYHLFPNAKYIVLKRNPFSVLYSIIRTWTSYHTYPHLFFNFYRDFLVAPYKIHEFCNKTLPKSNFLELKYESLVENPGGEVKMVYDWLQLEYTDSVLKIGQNEKVSGGFGDDVYKERSPLEVEKEKHSDWQNKIKNNQNLSNFFAEYANYLGPEFLKNYGYQFPDLNFKKKLFGKSDFQIILNQMKNDDQLYVDK